MPTLSISTSPTEDQGDQVAQLADDEVGLLERGSSNTTSSASRMLDSQPRPAYSRPRRPKPTAARAAFSSVVEGDLALTVADHAGEHLVDRVDEGVAGIGVDARDAARPRRTPGPGSGRTTGTRSRSQRRPAGCPSRSRSGPGCGGRGRGAADAPGAPRVVPWDWPSGLTYRDRQRTAAGSPLSAASPAHSSCTYRWKSSTSNAHSKPASSCERLVEPAVVEVVRDRHVRVVGILPAPRSSGPRRTASASCSHWEMPSTSGHEDHRGDRPERAGAAQVHARTR